MIAPEPGSGPAVGTVLGPEEWESHIWSVYTGPLPGGRTRQSSSAWMFSEGPEGKLATLGMWDGTEMPPGAGTLAEPGSRGGLRGNSGSSVPGPDILGLK